MNDVSIAEFPASLAAASMIAAASSIVADACLQFASLLGWHL